MKGLTFLLPLLKKYYKLYCFGVLALITVDGLQLVMPWILGNITDRLKSGKITQGDLGFYALILVGIAIGIAVGRFFWRYLVFGTAKKVENDLRNTLYSKLQSLSASYYSKHKTGDLMAHATNDIGNVGMATGQGVALIFDSLLIPVVALVMMLVTVGWKLTIASFVPLILLGFMMIGGAKMIYATMQNMQEAFSDLTESARESFSGIRIIKAFVQEAATAARFEKANRHNRKMNLIFTIYMSTLFPAVMTVSSFSFAIALWYGGYLVIIKEISLGAFVSFNGYLGMLVWPVAAIGWMMTLFQRGNVSMDRINTILNEVPEISDKAGISDSTGNSVIHGTISIQNLNFTYPGTEHPVLKDISFTLEAGKTLAVVGRTGSGKSTLLALLSRLYEAENGNILLDDIPIKNIPLNSLRKWMAAVPQDTFLFSSTIRENIDLYRNSTDGDIIKATETAKIHQNIMEFSEGYETTVGERGITLSGGQKQRIAIARAIMGDPAILLLDDCMSAVDARTEMEILKDLKQFMRQRTCVIVSHRISAIKDSDMIIVMDDGQILESGTHEDLLDKGGLYYEMYMRSQLQEQVEGA